MAFRVPVSDVSVVDLTAESPSEHLLERRCSRDRASPDVGSCIGASLGPEQE
jgi:hypothetical protein